MSKEHPPKDLLLAAIAGLVPDERPAPDVEGRLRATLLARIERPGMAVVRAEQGEWVSVSRGVTVKRLRADAPDGTETTLWRMAPGSRICAHGHRHDEECLVLEGSVTHAGVAYRAGDFMVARAGSPHGEICSEAGALLLIRGEKLPFFSPRLHD